MLGQQFIARDFLATGLGSGYSPVAPGTAGSGTAGRTTTPRKAVLVGAETTLAKEPEIAAL